MTYGQLSFVFVLGPLSRSVWPVITQATINRNGVNFSWHFYEYTWRFSEYTLLCYNFSCCNQNGMSWWGAQSIIAKQGKHILIVNKCDAYSQNRQAAVRKSVEPCFALVTFIVVWWYLRSWWLDTRCVWLCVLEAPARHFLIFLFFLPERLWIPLPIDWTSWLIVWSWADIYMESMNTCMRMSFCWSLDRFSSCCSVVVYTFHFYVYVWKSIVPFSAGSYSEYN